MEFYSKLNSFIIEAKCISNGKKTIVLRNKIIFKIISPYKYNLFFFNFQFESALAFKIINAILF